MAKWEFFSRVVGLTLQVYDPDFHFKSSIFGENAILLRETRWVVSAPEGVSINKNQPEKRHFEAMNGQYLREKVTLSIFQIL